MRTKSTRVTNRKCHAKSSSGLLTKENRGPLRKGIPSVIVNHRWFWAWKILPIRGWSPRIWCILPHAAPVFQADRFYALKQAENSKPIIQWRHLFADQNIFGELCPVEHIHFSRFRRAFRPICQQMIVDQQGDKQQAVADNLATW